MLLLNAPSRNGKKSVGVIQIVNVQEMNVMNNLTYKEYIKILELKKDGKLNKPIFIDFYADW